MLVVTTTVRVLHRVHRHTTNLGPGVALHLELVVVGARLEHGLVAATAARNLADGGAAAGRDGLLGAGGKLDAGEAGVGVVGDENAVLAGSLGEDAAVAELLLHVADDGTLGHGADGEDVANHELSLLAAVEELTGVGALGRDEELLVVLEALGVAESHLKWRAGRWEEVSGALLRDVMMVVRGCGFRVIWRVPHDATETAREWLATHLSEGSTTSGIVDDVGDDTLDVAMTFSEVLGVGEAEGIGGQPRRSDFSLWAASFGEKRE